jgi:hypothetical protein
MWVSKLRSRRRRVISKKAKERNKYEDKQREDMEEEKEKCWEEKK